MEGPGFDPSPSSGTESTLPPSNNITQRNTSTTLHATSVTLSKDAQTPSSVDFSEGSQSDLKRTLTFPHVQETQKFFLKKKLHLP